MDDVTHEGDDPLEIHETAPLAPDTEVPEEIEEKLQRLHGTEGDEDEAVTGA
jgi:hypothetical protein